MISRGGPATEFEQYLCRCPPAMSAAFLLRGAVRTSDWVEEYATLIAGGFILVAKTG
jgi:hypothetical protein